MLTAIRFRWLLDLLNDEFNIMGSDVKILNKYSLAKWLKI